MSHNFPPDFDINVPAIVPAQFLPTSDADKNEKHLFVDYDAMLSKKSKMNRSNLLNVQVFHQKALTYLYLGHSPEATVPPI